MNNYRNFLYFFCLSFYLMSCGDKESSNAEYQSTELGLKYRFLTPAKNGTKVKENGIVQYHLVVKAADSTWYDTYKAEIGSIKAKIRKGQNSIDINDVFFYASEGDSIEVVLSTDSLKKYNPRPLPPKLDSAKEISYTFKIEKVYETEEIHKQEEEKEILAYAKKNNLKTKKTDSGLYYSITQKNKEGKKANKGDTVVANYTGKLLNGKVFDTSVEEIAKTSNLYRPQKDYSKGFQFPVGMGRVVKGWDEGFMILREGEKATLLVPSHLGYGERTPPSMPPFSIMVFDVELLEVKEGKRPEVKENTKKESKKENK